MPRLTRRELEGELDDAELDSVPPPGFITAPEPPEAVLDLMRTRMKWHRYWDHEGRLCEEVGCEYDPELDGVASELPSQPDPA